MHGSSISLVSTASSLYSSAEEKQAHEIRKLRRELMEAQEKVHTLTSQLSTNVSALEYNRIEKTIGSQTENQTMVVSETCTVNSFCYNLCYTYQHILILI